MNRQELANVFLKEAGWQDAMIAPLAGDASNRRYDRVSRPDGQSAVLMDADPAKGEDVRPFVKIAQFLKQHGLSAPDILHADPKTGFLLIEDLGDRLFATEVANDPEQERQLYEAAVDVLTALHQVKPPPLLTYDAKTTVPLAGLAYDWYQFGAIGAVDMDQKAQFSDAFFKIIRQFDSSLTVLIQRDYHAENLLWLPDREGTARVGLLDFQDAMIGHPVYDLVSVLQDARRNVSGQVERHMMERFLANSGLEPRAFNIAYSVFGAQRNLRILGVFARLCLRDAKPHYVDLIPRVWRHLQTNLSHPILAPVAELIRNDLPEPDTALLSHIKNKSGTCSSL